EGFDAERVDPLAHLTRTEYLEPWRNAFGAVAVACQEIRQRLGMGDIHAASAGQQELAPNRRHGVVDIHLQSSLGQGFGRHQSGRTAAYDCYRWTRAIHAGPGYGDEELEEVGRNKKKPALISGLNLYQRRDIEETTEV